MGSQKNSFAALGLAEPLQRLVQQRQYRQPTPVQQQTIPPILAGRDVMAAAQTGTGKTAAFVLPVVQRLCQQADKAAANTAHALILVPTRELAQQVADSVRSYSDGLSLRSAVAYGGVSINPQMMALRKGVDILVATPGRLLDLLGQNAVRLHRLQVLVLDEADRMLDLGFQRDIAALLPLLPARIQTLLFSATFSPAIRELAAGLLRQPVTIDASPRQTSAVTVSQWLVPVDKARKPALFCHLLQQEGWPQVLVFAKTRKGVDQLATYLQGRAISCDTIHGDKPQPARLRALQRFKAGEVRVLVATDVAARGLDISALPVVINLDLPIVAEDYVHRIGRTGRAGASGEAISLVCADEVHQLTAIETLLRQVLPRREEPDFEPDHRVPETRPGGVLVKRPKKNKVRKPFVPAATASRPADRPTRPQGQRPPVNTTGHQQKAQGGNSRPGGARRTDHKNRQAVTKTAGKTRGTRPAR